MEPDESATEEFLMRIAPDLTSGWEGASPAEIAQVERLVAKPLPKFYRWFLSKMGRSMGTMSYPTLDFSVGTILRWYEEEDFVAPADRYLMIGYEMDEVMPSHLFYDLERCTRDDAMVLKAAAEGGEAYPGFETFREKLLYGKALKFLVHGSPQTCEGTFEHDGGQVFLHLDPRMTRLGFRQPVPMGDYCRVFERSDAALVCMGDLGANSEFRPFSIGAQNAASIRSILGIIAVETPLLVETDEWSPELRSS